MEGSKICQFVCGALYQADSIMIVDHLNHNKGLIHVFEVVNIRRGLKNGLTPECKGVNHFEGLCGC